MSKQEEEQEICYASLEFHIGGGLSSKLLNRHNSKKNLWSARRTPSFQESSFNKRVYSNEVEDTLSALPEIRLPAPPPPRTHSNALSQTDEKETRWEERQKPLLILGLPGFVFIAVVINLVVYDLYIQKDDSSVNDWCISLSKTDLSVLHNKMATTQQYTYEDSSRAMLTGILNNTVTESENVTPYLRTSMHENINDLTKTKARQKKYKSTVRRKPYKATTPVPYMSFSRYRRMRSYKYKYQA